MVLPILRSLFALGILLYWIYPAQAYERIISLKPNITEILFSLGLGEKIIGATTYCTRPAAATQIPRVADYIRVNPEKALSLRPDLILASTENGSPREVHFLESRGIPVVLLSFNTLQNTLNSIQKIGKLLGKSPEAEQITQTMTTKLSKLKKHATETSWKRGLFVVGYQPLVIAGSNNFFDEASPYIGIHNVAHASRLRYPTWSTEQLLRARPEIIWDISMETGDIQAHFAERQRFWQRFPSIPAVQSGQVHYFNIEKMRAVPSLPDAFEELYRMAHTE